LLDFLRTISTTLGDSPELQRKVQNSIGSLTAIRNSERNIPPVGMQRYPKPCNADAAGGELKITDFHPVEVARQLTLIDHSLLKRIRTVDFRSKTIESKSLQELAHHNAVLPLWITTEVLQGPTPTDRARTIDFFIGVAKQCLELRNYNGVLAVVSALDSVTVSRLQETWKYVDHAEQFEQLKKIVEPPFVMYQEALAQCELPFIPSIIVTFHYLDMLEVLSTFTRSAVGDTKDSDSKEINVVKLQRIHKVVYKWQQEGMWYELQPLERLCGYLLLQKEFGDTATLEALSAQLE